MIGTPDIETAFVTSGAQYLQIGTSSGPVWIMAISYHAKILTFTASIAQRLD
jgi:hypothetical protein